MKKRRPDHEPAFFHVFTPSRLRVFTSSCLHVFMSSWSSASSCFPRKATLPGQDGIRSSVRTHLWRSCFPMLHPMKLATSLLAVALLVPMAAQAQEIAGKWTATYPARVTNTNGNQEAEMGTAIVTIEQKGDSVFGTWHGQNTPVPSQPRTFRGTFTNGRLN